LGAVLAIDKALSSKADHSNNASRITRISAIFQSIDYRLVLIGSVLPDIIDKPIGIYLFRETFDNGWVFAHTLLFFLILFLVGLYRYNRNQRTGLLVLAFGSGLHLIFIRQVMVFP